jgi:hypothetical protein
VVIQRAIPIAKIPLPTGEGGSLKVKIYYADGTGATPSADLDF